MAVALPERIAIYELPEGAAEADMRYRLAASVPCGGTCGGLLLMGEHLIICQARSRFKGALL